jgi:hypothetical protein
MDDLNICKILARWSLNMDLDHGCGIDAFLIGPCPPVVQTLYLLSLNLALSLYQTEISCM